jgi:hypothetical protein
LATSLIRVLIVDDDPLFAGTLAELLESPPSLLRSRCRMATLTEPA